MVRLLLSCYLIVFFIFGCGGEPKHTLISPFKEDIQSDIVFIAELSERRWVDRVITVSDNTTDPQYDVKRVLEDWKNTGVNIEFVLIDGMADINISEDYIPDRLGESRICLHNTKISRADISLNTKTMNSYILLLGMKQHILCHEIGHSLGLLHNDEPNSCMNTCLESENYSYCMYNPEATTPGDMDAEIILEKYGLSTINEIKPIYDCHFGE